MGEMSRGTKALLIVGITLAWIIAFLGVIVISPFVIGVVFYFLPVYDAPEITYAEFPTKIVYEIDGEEITYEDVYICKYKATYNNFELGAEREWEGHFKNTGKQHIVLDSNFRYELRCYIGSPKKYMGDFYEWIDEETIRNYEFTPYLYIYDKFALVSNFLFMQDLEEELDYEEHADIFPEPYNNIKLIDWELSRPIVNSFE